MLDEPSNTNLQKILRATDKHRRTHEYSLDDLLKVFNIEKWNLRFPTPEVHALLNGGYSSQNVPSDNTSLTLPQAGVWDVLRVAIDLCDSDLTSDRFCVVQGCLDLMLDSSLRQELRDIWLNDYADTLLFNKVVKEELLNYYASVEAHNNDATQKPTDFFSHILMTYKEWQGNYLYRVTKGILVSHLEQSYGFLSFLSPSAGAIESLIVDFLRYVPRFAGIETAHSDDFLCSNNSVYSDEGAMRRLVRVLLLGTVGSEIAHSYTGDENFDDLINKIQDMTFRPTFLTISGFGYSTGRTIVAEAFVAQLESCIQDLIMAGTWDFTQGRGTYPVQWNTDAIPVLEQEVAGNRRDSQYVKRLLQLTRREDAKNRRGEQSFGGEDTSDNDADSDSDDVGSLDGQQHVAGSKKHHVVDSWNEDSTQPAEAWPDKLPYDESAWQGTDHHNLIWNGDLLTTEASQPLDTWFDHAAPEPESVNDNTEVANLIWQKSPPGFIEDVDSPQPFFSSNWDEDIHVNRKAAFDDWFIDWNDVFVDELPTFANKNDTYADSAIGDLDWNDDYTARPAASGQWDDDAEKHVDWNEVNSLRPEVYYSGTFSVSREGYSDDYADWNGVTSLGPNDYSHVLHLSNHVDVDDHVDWNAVTSISPDSYFPGSFAVFKKDNDEVSLVWENDPAAEPVLRETGIALDDYTLSSHDWNGVNSENPRSYGDLMADDNNGSDLGNPQDQEDSQPVMGWGVDAGHGLSWDAPTVDDNNNFEENLISAPTMDWGQTMPALWDDDNAQDLYWGSDAGNNETTLTEWSNNQTSNWNDNADKQAGSWGVDDPQGLSWDIPAGDDEHGFLEETNYQAFWNDIANQQAGSWDDGDAQDLTWDNPAGEDEHTYTDWTNTQTSNWNDHAAEQPASWNTDAVQDLSWDAPAGDGENTYSEWDSHQVSNWDDHATQDLLWDNAAVDKDNTLEENIAYHALDWGYKPSNTWGDKKSWTEDVAEPFASVDNDAFVETSFDWDQDATYRTAAWDGQVTKSVTWDDDRNLSWENNDVSPTLDWNYQGGAEHLSWDNNEDKQERDWENDDGVQKSSWENDETAQNDLWDNNDTAQDVSWNNDDAQFGSWINNEPTQTLTWEDYEAAQDSSWDNDHHTHDVSWHDDNDDAQLGTWDNNTSTQHDSWNSNEAAQSLTWEKYEAAQQLLWDNNDSNHNLTKNEHTLSAWNNDNAAVFPGDSASTYAADNDDGEGDVSAETDWNHNWGQHSFKDDYNPDMSFHARPSKSYKSVAWSDNIAAISEPKSYFWTDNTEASPSSDRSEHETSEFAHEQHDYWGRGSAWTAGERSPSEW